jgi:hypothetical protein
VAGGFSDLKRAARLGSQVAEGDLRGVAKLGGKLGGRLVGSAASGIRLHGLKRFVEDLEDVENDIPGEVNAELRGLATAGALRASRSASEHRFSEPTVSGFKPAFARATTKSQWAAIRQTRRRKTGRRPDFGRIQMERVLEPIGDELEPLAVAALERAVDRALRHNGL